MKTLFVTSLLLIASITSAAPELKGSPKELKTFLHPRANIVSIEAQAQEKAYSDKAIINLIITTESKKLASAIKQNRQLREKISNKLIKAGIKRNAIKSSKFSSSPEYGWFGKEPSSYKVINRIAISIFNASYLEEIALLADKNSNISLSSTTFEHSKKEEYQQKAREKALKNIMQQKSFYEKSLGIKLSAVNIVNAKARYHATRGALMLDEAVMAKNKSAESKVASARYEREPHKASFDEVIYEANLTIDFKIEH